MVQHKKHSLTIFLVVLLLINLISISIVLAQTPDNPTAGLESATGGALTQEGIDNDKINQTAYGWKSKAEQRIDSINQWLENNASWLKAAFGMVPEISWLFAIVIYFWLLFFVNLVLNGNIFGIFLSNKNYARIAGAAIFVILVVTKLLYKFGAGTYKLADWTWNKFLPYGIVIAIILIVIFIIILVILAIYAPQVLVAIQKWREERRKKQKEEEQETNQKALGKLVEGATGEKS